MRTLTFSIDEAAAGQTVEAFLLRNGVSKRLLVKLKQTADGLVLDGVRARSTAVLAAGQMLAVTPPQRREGETRVPILYEDDDLLAVDKPAGLPCHRSGGHVHDTLEQCVALRPLRAVGRLDKDTSGLLVLAKHQLAAARLHGRIEKTYLAVVSGGLPQARGAIELPLLRERPYEPRQIADPAGMPARTRYRVVWAGKGRTAVFCALPTGRMHQIRAHFAAIGHPLLGDALYGGDCDCIGRQALHCLRAAFTQPASGEALDLFCPPPQDLLALLPQEVRDRLTAPSCREESEP